MGGVSLRGFHVVVDCYRHREYWDLDVQRASAWLMTNLNPDPFIVSLVQVANTLPMFLFALPAGALADLVDRRRFLIIGMVANTILAATYAAIVGMGVASALNLLLFTFLIGVASALWRRPGPRFFRNSYQRRTSSQRSRQTAWVSTSPERPGPCRAVSFSRRLGSRCRSGLTPSAIWGSSPPFCGGIRRRKCTAFPWSAL